jgi:hypothetical protein
VTQAPLALPEPACEVGTWAEVDPRIVPARAAMTHRAGRWVTAQVGRRDLGIGRPSDQAVSILGVGAIPHRTEAAAVRH